jgi:hypothetical protein
MPSVKIKSLVMLSGNNVTIKAIIQNLFMLSALNAECRN